MRKSAYLVSVFSVLLLWSCGGSDDKNDKQNVVDVDTMETSENVDPEEFNSVLPSPVLVAEVFTNAGINFNMSLPNPVENVDKYSTSSQKNLNFGVYTSDLAFCIVSEKPTEAKSYLKAISTLANGIGLGDVFTNNGMVERFEKNIGNQDSLTDIMIEIKDKVESYYVENGNAHQTYVYFTGAWIEGMYLGAVSSVENSNKKAGKAMAQQLYMLDDVLAGLAKVKAKTEDYNKLITNLEDLKTLFKSLESVKNLPEEQMYDANLTNDEVKVLAEKLIVIRQSITKI